MPVDYTPQPGERVLVEFEVMPDGCVVYVDRNGEATNQQHFRLDAFRWHRACDFGEKERREMANDNRDDIEVESAVLVAPRRLDQIVSLRLDAGLAIALRDLASERGISLSDLLREAAVKTLAEARKPEPAAR